MSGSQLEIVVWNVQHGSAIYARTPNGLSIVMDAGASDEFSPAWWLKRQWSLQQVHMFILSHADTDHIRDIENLDRLLSPCTFRRNKTVPRELTYPTYPPVTNPLRYFLEFDHRYRHELPDDSPYRLTPASNWGGVTIRAFCSAFPDKQFDKLNDYSVATFLLYGNLEFLFPGDLEAPGWKALMEDDQFLRLSKPSSTNQNEVRILVAAHHGHAAGVYRPFLDLYKPHITMISGEYGDEYTDDTSYRRVSLGYPVYDREQSTSSTRYVLTTKVNDYILIRANLSSVTLSVP